MNLTNEIIGGLLLILLFGVTFLIRYAFIGRNIIRHTQMRLSKIEEEVQKHPLTCPLKQQIEQQTEQQSLSNPAAPHFSQTACFQSRLTTAEVEVNFRNYFTSLYPNALHRLRTISPRITRVDELLCMLILLKQNNEEIAHLLGVSRSTVLKNRYRLRCKLQLPGGVDLDTEVRSLLAPEEEKTPPNMNVKL